MQIGPTSTCRRTSRVSSSWSGRPVPSGTLKRLLASSGSLVRLWISPVPLRQCTVSLCVFVRTVRRPGATPARTPKEPESNGRIEIFLDERDDRAVRMTVPEAIERADPAFVQEAGRHYRSLRRDSQKAFNALRVMARGHGGDGQRVVEHAVTAIFPGGKRVGGQ